MNHRDNSSRGPASDGHDAGHDDGHDDGHDTMRWVTIDHVQLAMPAGGEDAARDFYVGVLGFTELAKPAALAVRGGCWFVAGSVQVHLGVEAEFRPARKAHPALVVRGLREFVESSGLAVRWSEEIPGTMRCHTADVFGNRLELIDERRE